LRSHARVILARVLRFDELGRRYNDRSRSPAWGHLRAGRSRFGLAFAGRIQGRGYGVVDPLHPHETDLLARGVRYVLEVLAVARRQHHRGDAGTRCRQHLSFTPPMGSTSPRSEISRSSRYRCSPCARQQGDQRHEHSDARARAVLGDGACRHVDVHVGFLEQAHVDAEIGRPGLHQSQGRLRGSPS